VKGSAEIVKAVSRRFKVEPGGTTEDFELSLEDVACFGSCALAPVMVVDGVVHGSLTPERAVEILEELT
jgi:NADH:ubiquinone oxidoreductase subunit E